MEQSTTEGQNLSIGSRDILTDILRRGAEEMLAMAIENEVAEYIARHAHLRDGEGRRLVVRNGHLPARTIQTGIGDMAVRQPRSTTNGSTAAAGAFGFPAAFCLRICGGRRVLRN